MIATRIEKVPDPKLIELAASLLKEENAIAFPTETVYGLGADASSRTGLLAIYEIKGRPKDKPLPIMIANLGMLEAWVREISPNAKQLMENFWPGPLTLILPAKPRLSPILTAGKSTLAVRFPNHPIPIALIREIGGPLAVTSANVSGRPSPVTAVEVMNQLSGKIPLILDGGRCMHGRESTIVDCTTEEIRILRQGAIPKTDIEFYKELGTGL